MGGQWNLCPFEIHVQNQTVLHGHICSLHSTVEKLQLEEHWINRLLRDFDDKIFTKHPSEHLQAEDIQLVALTSDMKIKFDGRNV